MGERATMTAWRACFFLTLALAAAVYAGSLDGGWVWDDPVLVSGEAIGGGRSVVECLARPFLGSYFRPLVSLTFFAERRLFGESPAGYRLVNLALHVGATACTMGLALAALRRRAAAIVAGLLFAVQPAQVGAVAWIGGLTDGLAAFWTAAWAGLLVAGVRRASAPRAARVPDRSSADGSALAMHAGAVACYTAMVLSKEQMAAALPLVPFAWHAFRPAGRRSLSDAAFGTLPYLAATAVFAAMWWFVARPPAMGPPVHLPGPAVLAGQSVAYYALMLAAPAPRWMHTLSEGFARGAPLGWAALGWTVAAGSALLWLRWLRRWREGAWLLAFVWLSLLPVLNVVALPYVLLAPYRAACGGVAFAVLAAGGLGRLRGRARARLCLRRAAGRRVRAVVATVLVVWWGALTAWGATRWRSEEAWFGEVVRHDPQSVVARYMLARTHLMEGRWAEGAALLEEVLDYLLGRGAWRLPDRAASAVRDPVVVSRIQRSRGFPEDPRAFSTQVLTLVGWARLQLGEWREAAQSYRAALAVTPGHAAARVGLEAAEARREAP